MSYTGGGGGVVINKSWSETAEKLENWSVPRDELGTTA